MTAKEAATLQRKAPKVGGAGARKTYQQFTLLGYVVESLKKLVYFVSYVIALAMNLRACLLMELSLASFEFWTVRVNITTISLLLFPGGDQHSLHKPHLSLPRHPCLCPVLQESYLVLSYCI